MKQIVESEHIASREMLVDIEHPIAGKVKIPGLPVKFSHTPSKIKKGSPALGEHTREVLADYLGYDAKTIDKLQKSNVI